MEALQLVFTFYESKRRTIQRTILKDLWQMCLPRWREGSASQILYWHNRAATLSMQQASSHYCCFLQLLNAISLLPITVAPFCSISRRFYSWGAWPVLDPCASPCNGFVLFWDLGMQHGAGTRKIYLILSWLINWPSWCETVTSVSVGYRMGEGAWHLISVWLSHPRNASRSPRSPHGASRAPSSFRHRLSSAGLVHVGTAAESLSVVAVPYPDDRDPCRQPSTPYSCS